MKRKGNAFDGLAVVAIGLILFTIPTVYNQGLDDFGVAGTQGIGEVTDFPPWENRTVDEMNINYSDDSIRIDDGSATADYNTVELTNEPDEFRLVRIGYNASLPETDSNIVVNATTYDRDTDNFQSQTITLQNGSNIVDLEERLVGENLRLYIDMSRQNANDPSPELRSLNISVSTMDDSGISQVWEKMLGMAVIGFAVTLVALLLGS